MVTHSPDTVRGLKILVPGVRTTTIQLTRHTIEKQHPIVSEADRLACDFSADSGERQSRCGERKSMTRSNGVAATFQWVVIMIKETQATRRTLILCARFFRLNRP